MTLTPGRRLGPYEILSPLGAGGMGEVYRARDPRLGREVAVKMLPVQYSSDEDRVRRFEQEARAVGMLNHPNILTVYDIGTQEGSLYVVSELLVGETLREQLSEKTPLSARKTVEYALQIAHGLAAAHEKGIIHRDLKPENLFVTNDGRVKILDFGLAKLISPEPVGAEQSRLQTIDPGTQPGLVLGTVGYMSPEQVRGRQTDHRSDIFSFGAILHEMLSGRRAFQRDSTADTMSAILKEDPPELSVVNPSIPPALERVVRHCLEKNPEQRFQSARDLAFDLEMISGISGTTAATAVSVPERTEKLKRYMVAAFALIAAFVLGVFATKPFAKAPVAQTVAQVSQPAYQRLTFRRGYIPSARFAPDGRSVIYSAALGGNPIEIFSKRQEGLESRALGLTSVRLLSISSSGEMAILKNIRPLSGWMTTGTLATVPIDGGAPREILQDVQEADWSPNGKDLAVVRTAPIFRLEYPPGKVLYQTRGWISHPRISPNGEMIAFLDHPHPGDDRGFVAVVDRSGKKRRLTEEWSSTSGLVWAKNGQEIWFSASKGVSRLSIHSVSVAGSQRIVLQTSAHLVLQDISANGDVLLNQDDRRREIIGKPPGSTEEINLSWFDYSMQRDLSPDGKTLLFEEEGDGGGPNYTIYLRSTDGGPAVRLGEGYAGSLSSDGKWVLSALPVPNVRITLLPTGVGEQKTLDIRRIDLELFGCRLLKDGKQVLVLGSEPGRPSRYWVYDIDRAQLKPATPEGINQLPPLLSREQDSLLLPCGDHYCLYPIRGGTAAEVSGLTREDVPVQWTADGRSVYVIQRGLLPAKVFLIDLRSGRRSLWKEITPPDPTGISSITGMNITSDGTAYVYNYRRINSDLFLMKGLN